MLPNTLEKYPNFDETTYPFEQERREIELHTCLSLQPNLPVYAIPYRNGKPCGRVEAIPRKTLFLDGFLIHYTDFRVPLFAGERDGYLCRVYSIRLQDATVKELGYFWDEYLEYFPVPDWTLLVDEIRMEIPYRRVEDSIYALKL